MTAESLRSFLFPREEEREPRFRQAVERLSLIGLRVIASVCAGAPIVMYGLGALFLPTLPAMGIILTDSTLVLMGAVSLLASFYRPLSQRARPLGILLGFATAALQSTGMMASRAFHSEVLHTPPEQHFPMILTIVLLVGVTVLPVKPTHTFFLGSSSLAYFTGLIFLHEGIGGLRGWSGYPLLLCAVVVWIATGLTGVMYRQRAFAFRARFLAERSFEELKQAQASLVVERNTASQARFAALLSHELGSPLGALGSAFETLDRLVQKHLSHLESEPRWGEVYRETVQAGRSSFQRLEEVTARMRNLTNLDRSDVRVVDLNELVSDTVTFLKPELERAEIELHLSTVPQLKCRPDQIGAVVANLLRNAAAAIEERGRIRLTSSASSTEIRIEVKDDGRGIDPERIPGLFEPGFHIDRGRVGTTNWGLFVSQSIMIEHGGSLRLASAPGRGTTAILTLPLATRIGRA